ncbi:MAG TPA: glycosyltransferase [Nitrososphaeraceae archaeon]|nr:glycosyltransferase [Nitrososphaeraceae archaeon]
MSCWIYIFANSFRSYRNFKSISIKQLDSVVYNNIENKDVLPYVSVIVPARNEQDKIERCLVSLIEQDYPNLEIIAVDDNSTDKTLKIMKKVVQKYYCRYQQQQKQQQKQYPLLKIIELKNKPENWTGKTWASERGYLASNNEILLFVDADCYYEKSSVRDSILYMLNEKEKIDVLTGYPFIELRDFWSKITMPLWKFMFITLGKNTSDVNNPKSKNAFLMGCFFMLKRSVFENIGTFKSVRNAIQEDEALGIRLKKSGYKLKIINMNNYIRASWSRDLSTLWHGIARTLAPLILKEKRTVFINFIAIFFITILPFITLLFHFYPNILSNCYGLDVLDKNNCNYYWKEFLILNLIVFFIIIVCVAWNSKKIYKISPFYALFYPIGSVFLFFAYLSSLIPLILSPLQKDMSKKTIEWKGRIYTYKRVGGSMV